MVYVLPRFGSKETAARRNSVITPNQERDAEDLKPSPSDSLETSPGLHSNPVYLPHVLWAF